MASWLHASIYRCDVVIVRSLCHHDCAFQDEGSEIDLTALQHSSSDDDSWRSKPAAAAAAAKPAREASSRKREPTFVGLLAALALNMPVGAFAGPAAASAVASEVEEDTRQHSASQRIGAKRRKLRQNSELTSGDDAEMLLAGTVAHFRSQPCQELSHDVVVCSTDEPANPPPAVHLKAAEPAPAPVVNSSSAAPAAQRAASPVFRSTLAPLAVLLLSLVAFLVPKKALADAGSLAKLATLEAQNKELLEKLAQLQKQQSTSAHFNSPAAGAATASASSSAAVAAAPAPRASEPGARSHSSGPGISAFLV
jgi:hypothetical protein